MTDRKINYSVASTEWEARKKGLDWLQSIEGIPPLDWSGYDVTVYVARQKVLMWSWRIVMLPKTQHPMIYPEGGFYTGGEPYRPSGDALWGAYEEIPCVEVVDREGNVVEYAAFQIPDKCARCPFRDSQKPLESCVEIPVCSKNKMLCGKKISLGCQDFPEERLELTEKEIARKELEMWEEIDRRGITLSEYLKEKNAE